MKLFLDTSSLIKLYYQEADSDALHNLLINNQINVIFLSELSKIEFSSAIWKKVRTGELAEADALILQEGFESDFSKYVFIEVNQSIIQSANRLIKRYGISGLRTLDSIQLASVVKVKQQIDIAKTADIRLEQFLQEEGINTQ